MPQNKPKQIIALEKAWGITIRQENYTLNEDGELVTLSLWGKSISNLSPLQHLTQLEELGLWDNQISDLSPLQNLTQLEELFLNDNKIFDLSPLQNLIQLKSLDLNTNQIFDLSPLQNLTQLKKLSLWDNQISDLSPLQYLTQLKKLSLWDNQISDLSPLQNLTQLKVLGLWNNQISDLRPLQYLPQLERLYLEHNQIRHIPFGFIEAGLDLLYNPNIFDIKPEKYITLNNNPLESPPKETILEGMDAVRAWYADKQKTQEQGETLKPLDEVRVIIIGNGEVGKTTLKKRLLGLDIPATEAQTDGIDISIMQYEGLKLRLWDFGGQEIQHSVHKLFLEDNCVYILVLNKRRDQQSDGTLTYWLNHIRSFGKTSPILIVENQIDSDPNINSQSTAAQIEMLVQLKSEIRNYYHSPASPIDFVGISAKEGYNMATFKEKLGVFVHQQNNTGQYPPTWLAAKNKIEDRITGGTGAGGLAQKNYISNETFDLSCVQEGIVETQTQNAIRGVMRRLGLAFYFESRDNRNNWLILNPEWVTVGMYSLILDKKVKELNGRLLKSDLRGILEQPANGFFSHKKDYTFQGEEIDYILGLMQNYELCYTADQEAYFLPMGFGQNYSSDFQKNENQAIAFLFEYNTLPKAIWYKFLVRLFKRKLVHRYWDSGIEVKGADASGLVEFLTINEKRIKIWISGQGRIELLTLLRYELDFVNEDFSNIKVTPKTFTNTGKEIDYADALISLAKNRAISVGFDDFQPISIIQNIELPAYTYRNLQIELHKTNKELDETNRLLNNALTTLIKQLKDSNNVNINIITNTNTNNNTNANRLELPYESNALEGKLSFLLEELQKKQSTEAPKVEEVLAALTQIREIPTKEEAQRKGFFEKFKKYAEYFKTGSELMKNAKEITEYIDFGQIEQGIKQVMETIQQLPQ